MLYGLRGVGKTVLLTQLRHDAQQREWVVVQVEGGTGRALRELLGEAFMIRWTELRRPSSHINGAVTLSQKINNIKQYVIPFMGDDQRQHIPFLRLWFC